MTSGRGARFIVVEGPEGAGKSTLVAALAGRLRGEGRDVVQVREPGGTPVAEAARTLALTARDELSPAAELFLILAARADLVARVIRPALERGGIVVTDRFELSTVAYQVGGRGLPAGAVAAAAALAAGGLAPDLLLVLDVPPSVGRERQRQAGKSQDRFEREDDAFHDRVRAVYRAATGPGVVHLDATQSPQAVFAAAWRDVAEATLSSTRGVQ